MEKAHARASNAKGLNADPLEGMASPLSDADAINALFSALRRGDACQAHWWLTCEPLEWYSTPILTPS